MENQSLIDGSVIGTEMHDQKLTQEVIVDVTKDELIGLDEFVAVCQRVVDDLRRGMRGLGKLGIAGVADVEALTKEVGSAEDTIPAVRVCRSTSPVG